MKITQCLFFVFLTALVGLVSCQRNAPVSSDGKTLSNQVKDDIQPTHEVGGDGSGFNDTIPSKENRSKSLAERYPEPRDSVLRNYVDHRKPPQDSIDKWNADVMAAKEKYTLKPDERTKKFTIDPKTGEVHGCPYIKFKGFLDDEYWTQRKLKDDSLRARFAPIKPKIRPIIMEGKENELWYGDPKNVEIEGTPEAVHSGRGPIGFLFADDNKYLIVPAGYPHGGMMDEIFFFDTAGNLLSKTVLDRQLNMPSVDFNAEQTFVIVSNGVSGDFYFFRLNGELFRKGNFNELTGDRGTSYGKPVISESGKYWVLDNNVDYVFNQDGELILNIIIGGGCYLIEKKDMLIYSYGSQISILNINDKFLRYQSNFWAKDNIGYFSRNNIQFSLNNKIYNYEIVD